ncbi:13605_t:CDS:2, partial [Gigaspora rosea]
YIFAIGEPLSLVLIEIAVVGAVVILSLEYVFNIGLWNCHIVSI